MSAIPGAELESRNFQPSSTRQLLLPSALAWNLREGNITLAGSDFALSFISARGHPCSGIPTAGHIGF